MLFDRKPSTPGDIRLWRRREHGGEWTLRCDDLIDAVAIADYTAAEGWAPVQLTVQRLEEDGEWREVAEAELAAVRAQDAPDDTHAERIPSARAQAAIEKEDR